MKIEYDYEYTWTVAQSENVYTPNGIICHNLPLHLGRIGISPHQKTIEIRPDPREDEYYMIMQGSMYEVIKVEQVHHNHISTVERGALHCMPAAFPGLAVIYPIDLKWTRTARKSDGQEKAA